MPDTTLIPDVIRESAPMHATRLDLVAATIRARSLDLATARADMQEAFAVADDLLRVLKRFQTLPTNRKQEMRDWLCETAGRAIDQLGNVEGAINLEIEEYGCQMEPLDLSELEAFWRSVDDPVTAQTKGEG